MHWSLYSKQETIHISSSIVELPLILLSACDCVSSGRCCSWTAIDFYAGAKRRTCWWPRDWPVLAGPERVLVFLWVWSSRKGTLVVGVRCRSSCAWLFILFPARVFDISVDFCCFLPRFLYSSRPAQDSHTSVLRCLTYKRRVLALLLRSYSLRPGYCFGVLRFALVDVVVIFSSTRKVASFAGCRSIG